MKRILTSALVALLLFGATTVTQASHTITGPNVLGTSLFGQYSGDFRGVGRTLPFTSFYMTVYPNGYVSGYLETYRSERSAGYAYAYFYGTVDKKGAFETSFYYNDKYYTLNGKVDKTKKAIGVVKPYRKNNALGAISGTLSKTSYAPSSLYYDSRYTVYGNGFDFEFYFYDDGTFEAWDYSDGEDYFEGDYSFTKLGSNLARLTIYAEDGAHVFLIYYFGYGYGVTYDTGTGKFHYFSDSSED